MLLLTSTSDLLQVITGQAVTVDVHASWVDNAAGTITPGRTNTAITTAATTTVVASPAAATQRNIQTLVIRNKAVASSVDVTVQHTDGATPVELYKLTLLAGHELQWLDGVGFHIINTLGQVLGQGAKGDLGPQGIVIPPMFREEDAEDRPYFPWISNRANVPGDTKNEVFLGIITGTGVTVGPLIFPPGDWEYIRGGYIIGGYNGGTPIGRILMGSASISTTALTNGNKLIADAVVNATSVSVPGIPTAVLTSNIARHGNFWISGASGALKQIDIIGKNGNPAVATSPTSFIAHSFFSDLGTNLLIKRLQLTVYDIITGATVSAQTFTATTSIWAWGRMRD